MEEESGEPRLFLGCKKEGCNGVLCVSKGARHGMPFQCPRCLNKQKYCSDCKQLYINFRRHRQLGHELYEFQRKRQVLMRNNHGLFIPGKYVLDHHDHDQNKKKTYNPGADPMNMPQFPHQQRHHFYPPHHFHPQQQHHHGFHDPRDGMIMREGENGVVRENVDTGELEDASDILVKLLHSSNKGGPQHQELQQQLQQHRQQQQQQQGAPTGSGGGGFTPPRPAPSGAGPTDDIKEPLPIATSQQSALGTQWATPFVNMSSKNADHYSPNSMNWPPPSGPMMPGRAMPPYHHPYRACTNSTQVPPPRPHVPQMSVSQV